MQQLLDTFSLLALIFLSLGFIVSGVLFEKIKKNHPKYHKAIGEPSILESYSASPTWGDFMHMKNAMFSSYTMVLKGIPKDFPDDNNLKRWAQITRFVFMGIILIFTITFTLVVISIASGG